MTPLALVIILAANDRKLHSLRIPGIVRIAGLDPKVLKGIAP